MTKIKEQITLNLSEGPVDILWYADDETGYGVEVISEDHGLGDFVFDHSIEGYSVSHAWYQVLSTVFNDQLLNLTGDVNILDNANITRLAIILETCVRELGYNPLDPLHLSSLHASSGYPLQPESKPDWVLAIKNRY